MDIAIDLPSPVLMLIEATYVLTVTSTQDILVIWVTFSWPSSFSYVLFLYLFVHIISNENWKFQHNVGCISYIQYAQKPHMHINFTRHFYKIILMSILNIILKSGHINIALLHDKISNKCHKIPSIGTLTCFIDTFCLINTNRF